MKTTRKFAFLLLVLCSTGLIAKAQTKADTVDIKIARADVKYILDLLAEKPYNEVASLLNNIYRQTIYARPVDSAAVKKDSVGVKSSVKPKK